MINKIKIAMAIVLLIGGIGILMCVGLFAEYILIEHAVIMIFAGAFLVLFGVVFAVSVDYSTGAYECRRCGHKFKPTLKAYIMGAHTITTRRLKCPECGEKSWCKRTGE